MELRSSPSVLRNSSSILDILKCYEINKGNLLEIGSGTAEHAVLLSKHFKLLKWHTSELKINHKLIKARIEKEGSSNILGPHTFRVGKDDFPRLKFDYVFTANTLHIMSWKECKAMFKLLGKRLRQEALVFIYGPFNYNGEFSSPSNETFDQWLKDKDIKSGIRNFEDVSHQMSKNGFELVFDHEMPANNRTLVFRRLSYIRKGN
ncbi:MAG: class I SAM-dependent methyltransferase [Bacteriovoracaceae bacterium]|jgi:hypothetical protein|nr:class I SAM-dependent methyltransferase [Bacteriovoracaceae bacterium]